MLAAALAQPLEQNRPLRMLARRFLQRPDAALAERVLLQAREEYIKNSAGQPSYR
ncbi:MAG: hypothetical protein ACRD1Y_06705 [Terriglobales bacterium]